jgi:formylglycine-generating enzyme required for sulfatase activity
LPNETFRECADESDKDYCPQMIVMPPGSFMMGSPPDEMVARDTESPQHEVTIANAFAVSSFEVTFDEWDTCVAYGDCDPHISDSGFLRGRHPVINVTWADAQRYVAWLSKMTGQRYRLLSEAEWEYAARAGTTTSHSFGSPGFLGSDEEMIRDVGPYAWFKANSRDRPHPVGGKKPNAFGLHDMHGNVVGFRGIKHLAHFEMGWIEGKTRAEEAWQPDLVQEKP